MRMRQFEIAPQTDADGICASQTPSGAGDLTLNGALVTDGVGYPQPSTSVGGARIRITAVGNESGNIFTITGFDENGRPISEAVTGPNATTADTSAYFSSVTSVSIDGAAADAITVGTNGEAASPVYVVNYISSGDAELGFQVDISGTANVTMYHTFDNVWDPDLAYRSMQWLAHDSIAAITATDDGNYDKLPRAVQLVAASSSGPTMCRLSVSVPF